MYAKKKVFHQNRYFFALFCSWLHRYGLSKHNLFCAKDSLYSFRARQFLSMRDFFFPYQNFSFPIKIFLLVWEFFFWWETFLFPLSIFLPNVEISSQPYNNNLSDYVTYLQCCEQDFLQSRNGRSLENKNRLWYTVQLLISIFTKTFL